MATIKHKRGTRAALDASPGLQQGELGLCTDTGELFIGNNGNHPILEQVAAKTLMGNTGSDKALPSAIPAADILEMIGGQAVIQYEVMPTTVTEGAVVQYIGEDTAEYVSGSWYRGENGEWVITSGGGGVYVGSGDMPNGYNVQIDPSGDVLGMGPYAAEDHNHDDVYAAVSHTHEISDVTNLQSTLDDKAPASHTHSIANVTNLQSTLNAKQATPSTATALPSSGTALTANTIYNVSATVGTYAFTAPSSGWAHGKFTTGSSASVSFAGTFLGAAPSIEASKTYEFDVLNGVWAVQEVVSA